MIYIYILHVNNKRVIISTTDKFNTDFAILKLSQTNTVDFQFIKSLTCQDFSFLQLEKLRGN
ncbi:hypothetical protein NTPn39_10785 [Streptococcus pneumoniae]|nr:hypothetical protein NTPn39_10785 [Streptococcus pneumoniae]PLV74916.1 hypothetical protein AZJ13_11130 [Streptococcus pneumoniae]